jgi:hypothetical protein
MSSNSFIADNEGVLALSHLVDATTHTLGPKFQVPPTSINFMEFPAEVREMIIDFDLLAGLDLGTLAKALHYDRFRNPCCIWSWPDQLIICDKANESDLPDTMFPEWLPHLALTNHQMRGEVLVHMLKTTDCITLKYDKDLRIKIACWFSKFLATFPANQGFNAVHNLNFPHMHWFNYDEYMPDTATNPDVDLMLQCPDLRRVGMTFHMKRITYFHPYDEDYTPMALNRFLDHWKLRPILGCDKLEHVYIGGIKLRDIYMAGVLTSYRRFATSASGCARRLRRRTRPRR